MGGGGSSNIGVDFLSPFVHYVNIMDIEARLKAASPAERRQAIIDAREAGWTFRRIADTVKLSIGYVHKIINNEKGATP